MAFKAAKASIKRSVNSSNCSLAPKSKACASTALRICERMPCLFDDTPPSQEENNRRKLTIDGDETTME